MEKKYDLFICHSSIDKEWVRVLVRNLEKQALTVFFDERSLHAGDNLVYSLDMAIEQSGGALLVVTPESVNSGWVKREYSKIFTFRIKHPDYVFIPLLLEGSHDFPFSDEILYIDFRESKAYREKFTALLISLEKGIPGFSGDKNAPVEVPGNVVVKDLTLEVNRKKKTIDDIFRRIDIQKIPVMVLFQAHKDQEQVIQELLTRAQSMYGEDSVIHVIPPYSEKAEASSYFSYISRQCSLCKTAGDAASFEDAMDILIAEKGIIFLLISGFEHGSYEFNKQLAGALRNLNKHYPDKFFVVLCGGQVLKELKFKQGEHSLLNIAGIIEWPDPGTEDTTEFITAYFPGLRPDKNRIETLLDMTGHHTGLMKEALFFLSDNLGTTDTDLNKYLTGSSLIGQVFHPVIDGEKSLSLIKDMLHKEDIYPYDSFLHDDLLRTLYWKNLLCWKEDASGNRYLAWRCPLIRKAGEKIVENYEKK
ncbi:MAG: toll/interleukin-1 receptor domain-containing protein [Spirochaetales bacterium]|nr:toll/interleukin-1 receptor domain-containing protein [Spirochaetales bacterium]